MNINWKVRIKNKAFWVYAIAAVLLLIQRVLVIFGISVDFTTLKGQLIGVVDAVFALITILGVINDPTTSGINDSKQAMTYDTPKKD